MNNMQLSPQEMQQKTFEYLGYMLHHKKASILNLVKKNGIGISKNPNDSELQIAVLDGIKNYPKFNADLKVFLIENASKQFVNASGANAMESIFGKKTFANISGSEIVEWGTDGGYDKDYNWYYDSDITYNTGTGAGNASSTNASTSSSSNNSFWGNLGSVVGSQDFLKNLLNTGLGYASNSLNANVQQDTAAAQLELINAQKELAKAQAAAAAAAKSGATANNKPTWLMPVLIGGGVVLAITLTVIIVKSTSKKNG